MTNNFVDIALYIAQYLLIISVLLGVLLPLISSIGNVRSLVKGLLGIVLIAAVFGIAYAFSGGEVTPEFAKFGIGPILSKIIGAGLISLYILLITSFVGIFISEIIKIFK